jgi:hypothetical protein
MHSIEIRTRFDKTHESDIFTKNNLKTNESKCIHDHFSTLSKMFRYKNAKMLAEKNTEFKSRKSY